MIKRSPSYFIKVRSPSEAKLILYGSVKLRLKDCLLFVDAFYSVNIYPSAQKKGLTLT